MIKLISVWLGTYLPALVWLAPAFGTELPGRIDPQQIQQNLPPIPQPAPLPQPSFVPPTPLSPPSDSLDNLSFLRVKVQGNTLFQAEIDQIVDDLNQQAPITWQQVQTTLRLIEQLYRERGYPFIKAYIPTQTVGEELNIQIVEAFLESLTFTKQSPKNRLVQRYFDPLIKPKPIRLVDLERAVLLVNALAGYAVTVSLEPGTRFGAVRMVAQVSQRPLNGFFSVDNWATEEVGPVRFQSGILVNSALDQGEQFILSGASTLFDFQELQNGRLDFQIPIETSGLTLNFGTGFTRTAPGASLKPLNLVGEAFDLSLTLRYPLILTTQESLSLQTTLDISNNSLRSDLLDPPFYFYQDRTRSLRLALTYNRRYRLGRTNLTLTLSQGLGGFLDGRTQGTIGVPLSRLNGSTTAFRTNLALNQFFSLPAGLILQTSAVGQLSSAPLLIGDQIGFGGSAIGSAYPPSQIIGDQGWGLRMELQRPVATRLGLTQPYLFADYAQVYNPQPPQTAEIASAGFGLRQTIRNNTLQFRLELAFPLIDSFPIKAGQPQFRFSLQGFF